MREYEIGTGCVNAAITVHRELGPGLLESDYEIVLAHELAERGLAVERQVPISISYKELVFPEAFRADLIVAGKVIIELKSNRSATHTANNCKLTCASPVSNLAIYSTLVLH